MHQETRKENMAVGGVKGREVTTELFHESEDDIPVLPVASGTPPPKADASLSPVLPSGTLEAAMMLNWTRNVSGLQECSALRLTDSSLHSGG